MAKGILLILFATLLLFRGYFVDQQVAIKAAQTQGYANVKVLGKTVIFPLGCGRADAVKFYLSAINPRNQEVKIYVCSGWPFKGSTVRTD